MILSIIAMTAALALLGAGYYFFRLAFFRKVFTPYAVLSMETENERPLDLSGPLSWPRHEVHIFSPFGYQLFGYYYPFPGSKKTVVFSHGITISLEGSLKYLPLFRRHGFNLFIYDNRFHGRSAGNGCSFGFYEKHDLKAIVDWVIATNGPDSIVGTHGESLGAAITLQHSAIDTRIAFAIADCGFSDLPELLRYRLKEDYHLPSFPLLPICQIYTQLLQGFDFYEASPALYISQINTPILFIHGDQDRYVPTWMSTNLYNQKILGTRFLYLVKGAKHAEALRYDPEQYQLQITHFLNEINLA